jgi:hypothetical protein
VTDDMQTGEMREDATGPWEVYAIAPESDAVRLRGVGLNQGLWDTRTIADVLAMSRPLTARAVREATARLRSRGLLPSRDDEADLVWSLRMGGA